jgi:poly [ADP-ribose] polymerase 10/14/15
MKNQAVAELFPLPPGPELYQVRQAFMKTLDSSSITNVNVQRIQNLSLWRQFANKRWEFVSREGPSSQARCERVWLFHGTDEDTVKKIVQQGFNRSFAGKNATVYGKGVYFARDASCKAANRTCLSNAVHLQPAK